VIGGETICPAGDPCATDTNFRDAYYWKSGVNSTTGKIEGTPDIQIKNHSYGNTSTFSPQDDSLTLALTRTAVNGVIHVFAAGNSRGEKAEDANKDADHNNSSVITVAALGSDWKFANYSSYGSSVFATAPSNRSDYTGFGITTTDRTGEGLGYNRYSPSNTSGDKDDLFPDTSYVSMFGGTSSAAPLVSGIMALGKEANPEMDVRMAKQPLEGVEVGLTFDHKRIGDLTAKVTSPQTGMQSRIMYSTSHLAPDQQDTASVTNGSWTFPLTNAFWGESATGAWTLNLADIVAGKTGTWLGYNVTLLMGEMILLTSGTTTQSADINAQSLTIANSATIYKIPKTGLTPLTFRVRNNVLVDGGTLTVDGQITPRIQPTKVRCSALIREM